MGETADRPDAGGEGAGGAEDAPRPAGERAEPLPVGLAIAVRHAGAFDPPFVGLPGERDAVVFLRLVLGDADQVLEAADHRPGEREPRRAAGEVADDLRGGGVDVLDHSGGESVRAAVGLVAVGEADLLVEDPLRVRGEREEAGGDRVAMAQQESPDAEPVEAGAEQDRRGPDRPGGQDDQRGGPARLPSGRALDSLDGGDPPALDHQPADRHAGRDREAALRFQRAEDPGGVVLRLDPAGEAVAGVAADALRRLLVREVDRQRQRERPVTQPPPGVADAPGGSGERRARVRIGRGTRRLAGVGAGGSVDAQQALRLRIERLHLVVGDRPAREVGRPEAQRRRPVEHGLPAHDLVHRDFLRAGALAHGEGAAPVAVFDQDGARVPVGLVPFRPPAPFEDQRARPGPGQGERRERSPETRTDDDDIEAAAGRRGAVGRRQPPQPPVASSRLSAATAAMMASAPKWNPSRRFVSSFGRSGRNFPDMFRWRKVL